MTGVFDIINDFKGQRVLIMGLGRFGGGVGAARFMSQNGAIVTITDMASADTLVESISELDGLDIEFHLGGHKEEDFLQNDFVIVNPAVPPDSKWLAIARDNQIPMIGEIDIFLARFPGRIVGITGSNGKSTTSAMTAAVLAKGYRVFLGGNIGKGSLLCQLDEMTSEDIAVVELSSFQLMNMDPDICHLDIVVVTNISPNHLDYHGTMQEYIDAKKKILLMQGPDNTAILNMDDPEIAHWQSLPVGRLIDYSCLERDSIELSVPGEHNKLNASAALAIGSVFGIELDDAYGALKDFKGLDHRLEYVASIDGVKFYNDSISTTPESVIAAIDSFGCGRVLILGGYDKKISFDGLADKLSGNVKAVVLIGQVADIIAKTIDVRCNGSVLYKKCDSMDQAVKAATGFAVSGDAVILSPACASYDMFQNFQQRGLEFVRIVNKLK